MNYTARTSIEKAIKDLKLALQPAKSLPKKIYNKRLTRILHRVKNRMDIATSEINGKTSTEWTNTHLDVEKRAENLINEYFTNGDIEAIHSLIYGLIAQLSEKQAQEHHQALGEQILAYTKRNI